MAFPRSVRSAVLLGAAVLLIAGCAVSSSPGSSASRTIRPLDSTDASLGPTSPVVGIVASVDPPLASPSATPAKTVKPSQSAKPGASPSKTPKPVASPSSRPVLGFTLLTTAGDTLTFVIGDLDNADEFPPQSLYDRLSTEDPIRVDFTVDGDRLIATHIEDAG